MKLPIPFLLYVVALGLFGFSGWTVYKMLPQWKKDVRTQAHENGSKAGKDCIMRGRGQGPINDVWRYTPDTNAWWESLKNANLIGTLPPPPEKPKRPGDEDDKAPPNRFDSTPLDQMFELVCLVYDGKHKGEGGDSHVIVRFKPEANVTPPEWYVRENAPPTPSVPMTAAPTDTTPKPANGQPARPNQPAVPLANRGGRGATPMPMVPTGRGEVLQKIWAKSETEDPRRAALVWPMKPATASDGQSPPPVFGTIRLVRIAPDAQSAWFVREFPVQEGQTPPERKEEELIKTSMGLPQDVLHALLALQGRNGRTTSTATTTSAATAGPVQWQDVEQTTKINGVVNIGREDEKRFGDSDEFFESLNVDTYVTKAGRKGLIVRQVDPKLAANYGVIPGDVLLEVNGQKVDGKAQAYSIGKSQYKQGVRTFVTTWLSNGQEVERVFQARDK